MAAVGGSARARVVAGLMLAAVAGAFVATAGTAGAATPEYELAARSSGGLTGRIFTAAAPGTDGDRVVLYGGETPSDSPEPSFADTWEYAGAAGWVPVCGTTTAGATAACGPGPRSAAAMGNGPSGAVLFGGSESGIEGSGPGPATDTWVYGDGGWTQACAAGTCGPGGRMFPAMGGNGEQVVMFGGLGSGGLLDDTWVFDGVSWTQTCGTGAPLACGPAGLAAAALGWAGTRFVMVGGSPSGDSGLSLPLDDTWTFDGAKWVQLCGTSMAQPCGPAARSLASMAWQRQPDAALAGAVLTGGGNLFSDGEQVLQRDVWLFRAGIWSQVTTPWDATPVTFTGSGGPPDGSGPLIPFVAARPADCQVVMVGQNPVSSGGFALQPQTFAGGWALSGGAAPDGCAAAPAGVPATPATAPAAPAALPETGSGAPTSQIARTGQMSDLLALVGGLAVLVGGIAVVGARPRRERRVTT